jgi:hypothetical protein
MDIIVKTRGESCLYTDGRITGGASRGGFYFKAE